MRVITLGSGSGGCGKTILAANLGLALSRRGVRTCLVDLDLSSADLHLRLGIFKPVRGLLHLLRGTAASLEEVVLPVNEDETLHLIPGAGETVRGLAPEEVEGLIEDIGLLPFDVAILDLAAGLGHQQLDLFLSGDEQWVVARAEPRAIESAARFLRLARLRKIARGSATAPPRHPKIYSSLDALVQDMTSLRRDDERAALRGAGVRPGLVLTCCDPSGAPIDPRLLVSLEAPVGAPAIVAELPEDATVPRSIAELTPVLDLAPKSAFCRAVEELATRIASPQPSEDPGAVVLHEPVPF